MNEATVDPEDQTVSSYVEDGKVKVDSRPLSSADNLLSLQFVQKVIAEFVGTYYLIFAGPAAIVVNEKYGKIVTLPGIALVWGLCVMVLVYSLGHISGAHFNPAVTIAFASSKRFPLKQVLPYIVAQVVASLLAAGTLRLVFDLNREVCSGNGDVYVGTYPSGANSTSFVIEFVTTFFLMFVISAVATDDRAKGEFAGVAIGSTLTLNILFSGPISGGSFNPARSLGPAIVWSCYKSIWIYILSPVMGAIAGAWVHNILRYTDKSLRKTLTSNCVRGQEKSPKEASDDQLCVVKVIDPTNQGYFVCSSLRSRCVNRKSIIVCKLE